MRVPACATTPVLTIRPATEQARASHPAATRMLVERHLGQDHVVSTDDDCPFGIEAAARAWAEATGAAWDSQGAS